MYRKVLEKRKKYRDGAFGTISNWHLVCATELGANMSCETMQKSVILRTSHTKASSAGMYHHCTNGMFWLSAKARDHSIYKV